MSRRSDFPRVRELHSLRGTPRLPARDAPRPLTQREMVAASLLLCPERETER